MRVGEVGRGLWPDGVEEQTRLVFFFLLSREGSSCIMHNGSEIKNGSISFSGSISILENLSQRFFFLVASVFLPDHDGIYPKMHVRRVKPSGSLHILCRAGFTHRTVLSLKPPTPSFGVHMHHMPGT